MAVPGDGPLVLEPSALRRVSAMAVLAVLAAVCAITAFDRPMAQQALLLGGGVLALVALSASWRAWDDRLIWTADGLTNTAGQLIAARADIIKVDRHALSLRPSQGFTLTLSQPAPRGWSPGLWWRIGRRVGVGGLTAPAASKAMADRIALDTAPR